MFTGIITDIGEVIAIEPGEPCHISIATSFDMNDIEIGSSIACSGCCLTVVSKNERGFSVDVSNETLSRTAIGLWKKESKINLERSLRLGDELGGHIVSGHVDSLAELISIQEDGGSKRMTFSVPDDLSCFIASKGSVALDGVSLTVNETEDNNFGVNIIPHTLSHTTFGLLTVGDKVNLEVDMLARYVARMNEKRNK